MSDGLPAPRRYGAIAAVLIAIFMSMLDGSLLNVALPSIATDLSISDATVIWLVNGYQLMLLLAVLPIAALGESLGFRRIFVMGAALFFFSSLICITASGWQVLLAGRLLQGLGSAAILSVTPPLLRLIYPSAQLGRGIALNALTVALSVACGPTIAAAVLTVASWPWLFVAGLPLSALALLLSSKLPRSICQESRLDLAGVILNILTFGLFALGIDRLSRAPSFAVALLLAAIFLGVVFWKTERRKHRPLIPFDLLEDRNCAFAVATSFFIWCGQIIAFVALPFYLQRHAGLDLLATGMVLTAWPLAIAAFSPIAGWLVERMQTATLATIGSCLFSISLLCIVIATVSDTIFLTGLLASGGLGFCLFQIPNNRAIITSAPIERSGVT
ncbi:MAG: MFS transporter [Bosea sp. (in: a-proteobacteria)]|nr:MFS transporter [Bosea sp. (in: a-proteobacteria)]